MNLSTIILKPGEADRHVSGHPWVYSSAVLRQTAPVADGDVVQVKDHRQRFLGLGFYNSQSKISVRLISLERAEIDRGFFVARIRAAAALRKRHLPKATSYRLINSESDQLSGLIVDRYGDVLVIQISSLGMDRRKAEIVSILEELFSPRAIVERSDISSRKFEGLPEAGGVLSGKDPGVVSIELNGLKFSVDLQTGHKTGMYLDQQVNYGRVAEFAKGADVLDCFSFSGGFALHAAKAGAKSVLGVDQSESAVALAAEHAKLNGLTKSCRFEVGNVFDWLKARTSRPVPAEGAAESGDAPVEKGAKPNPFQKAKPTEAVADRPAPAFDLIVLDPPSFTRNRAAVGDALRGYKEIHLRALRLLRPGGVLATFCCSHHVESRLFEEVILAAAFDARKLLRRVATYGQSPDHPVIPAIAETEYLKGFAYECVNS